MENKDLLNLRTQYHGCWLSDDARSQGINNHDIDLVKPGKNSVPARLELTK